MNKGKRNKRLQYTQEMMVSFAISTFIAWFWLSMVKSHLHEGDLFLLGIYCSFVGTLAVWQLIIWMQELKKKLAVFSKALSRSRRLRLISKHQKCRNGWGTTTARANRSKPETIRFQAHYSMPDEVAQ